MSDVRQTRRMACAIIANAMVFHEQLSGMHDEVRPLRLVCGDGVANPQEATLKAWAVILGINYWPIFAIAKDVLEQLPSGDAARILRTLRRTAQRVDAAGVTNAHDLTGRIFQRSHSRPQVSRHLLHAARVRRAARPARGRQDGR